MQINAATRAVVVGLGQTGLSAVRYLRRRGAEVSVTDTRVEPPGLSALLRDYGEVATHLGGLDAALLESAQFIVVSPGVAASGAFFDRARAQRLSIVGDIELFAQAVRAPVAGISGTNGKSTVTTLLGLMAEASGARVRTGGNLGPPALDLLDDSTELYVLELSSYQLERTESLRLRVAVLLNVTADHLDRYVSIEDYAAAKARLFAHCDTAVLNADDAQVMALAPGVARRLRFSLRDDSDADYTLKTVDGREWLSRAAEALLPVSELKLRGRHNVANALAALAAGDALGLPMPAMFGVLRKFPGLPHRMQWVGAVAGVDYINDSKGTNVGATLAAVAGLDGPLLVIAGGDGKSQDFTLLRNTFRGKVRCCLLIGRDAERIAQSLTGICAIERCPSLEAAVQRAAALAHRGDTVLLSPACASLDMFRDYAERGARFATAVEELAA